MWLQRPDGTYAHPHIVDNGDGTFTVSYVPDDLGTYEILIRFGGQVVPSTPFKVNTYPVGDATKCRITGNLWLDQNCLWSRLVDSYSAFCLEPYKKCMFDAEKNL